MLCKFIIYNSEMNLNYQREQETKTIKYLNKSDYNQGSSSSSQTEKQYQQELLVGRKIIHSSKSNSKHLPERPNGKCKIVVIQTIKDYGAQRSQGHNQPPKHKHKKGKSMDLEELMTNSRQERRAIQLLDGSKEKSKKQRDIQNQYKQRKSISEMKQYHNVSKRLGFKNGNEGVLPKKKKSKTTNSNEIKNIKKEMKKLIDDTPIFPKSKRKDSKDKSDRSAVVCLNSKNLKNYCRSQELFSQPKGKRKMKSKSDKNQEELRQISFSMPLTSKIIHLFSNNSSVYNSQKELPTLNPRQFIAIPTQQSCEQIPEIREYEHTLLRKKSSGSLRQLRKATPINSLIDQEVESRAESTSYIISNYIERFKNLQERNPSQQDLAQMSNIQHLNSELQKNIEPSFDVMGSLSIGQMHGIPESLSLKLEQSQIFNQSQINKQETDLIQLTEIIKQIQKKGNNLPKNQREAIFDRIKGIIQSSGSNSPQKEVQIQKADSFNLSNLQLSNSELKESLNFDQNMSQLNLELLDKALRERESYLIERKDKQLQKLQQLGENTGDDVEDEKDRTTKWLDHEIKSVIHTRHQLWKGFNIAKNLLDGSQGNGTKKGQMMKCLSDKYLNRTKDKKNKHRDVKHEKESKRIEVESSEKGSDDQLGKGRVTSLEVEQQALKLIRSKQSNVQVQFPSDDDEDEPLLISQGKINLHNKMEMLENVEAEIEDQEDIEDDLDYDRNNILNKPIQFYRHEGQSETPDSINLDVKKIECDNIDYQDSYSQGQLDALVTSKINIKEEQVKIPFNMSIDDKEDIYEFIFLDLCVQLTDQYSVNSKVIKKIFSFIKQMNQQSKKQKGFRTNTLAVKQYLFQFISFLKNQQPLLDQVYGNIEKPLGPTALDILKYMHPYDEQPMEEESNETVFILDIRLFEQFENQHLAKISFQKYYQDQEKQKKRRAFLKNAIHIHNKAIFDALNQTLDKQRPFGVWGEPFSWKKSAKFYHQRNTASKNAILLKSSQKTIEYGAFMCGFMTDKQDCNLRGNPNISQAYIDQIRDDRLSRMLANDLQEGEEKMLFIDDEETQILVEVGLLIYQTLLSEICQEWAMFQ